MSSYQCKNSTISRVAALISDGEYLSEKALKALAESLAQMNLAAVNARYKSETGETDFTWIPGEGFVDSHAIDRDRAYACKALKTVTCFLYQCSEGDIPERVLYKRVELYRLTLQNKIIGELKEYDDAPWE